MTQRNTQEAELADTLASILEARGDRYGDFGDNARISQMFKRIFRAEKSWGMMKDVQKETLDMVAVKISRILTGDPTYEDNWTDIQGYVKLVLNFLQGDK